jgi:hypothetical protein
MKKTTLTAIGAALVASATLVGVTAATADGWGGRGGHHGMRGGDGPMHGMMGRGGMGGPMRMLEQFDTDKDGKLTQAEIDAGQKAKFAEANKDGQGGVSIQEFEPFFWAQHREMMVRAFQMLDSDGDGQVTEAEISERTAGMVERMDRNGDGALSRDDRGGRGWGRGDRDGRGPRWGWGDDDEGRGPGMGEGPGMGQGMGQGQGQGQGNDPGPGAGQGNP